MAAPPPSASKTTNHPQNLPSAPAPNRRKRFNPWFVLGPVIVCALPLFLAAYYVLVFGYSWTDGFDTVKNFAAVKTRYAQGFSEPNLMRVKHGMTGDQVYRVIGQPFEGHVRNGKVGTYWHYSLPKGTASYYHERAIVMNVTPGSPPTVERIVRKLHRPNDAPTP